MGPLGDNFPRVELHQHRGVCLEIFDGNSEAEIIEKEELELEVVQFGERETTNLQEDRR